MIFNFFIYMTVSFDILEIKKEFTTNTVKVMESDSFRYFFTSVICKESVYLGRLSMSNY